MQFALNRQLASMDLYQRFTQLKTEKPRQVVAARTTLANEEQAFVPPARSARHLNEAGG